MTEMYMSEEARSMRAGKTEALAIVREFGDPNSGDYQDPFEEIVEMPETMPQDIQRERADVAAVRAEFEAMIKRNRDSRVQ